MGWTFYPAKHYKKGKIDRKAECDALFSTDKLTVLKSQMVGSVYYAAVHNNNDDTFGVVCLTSVDKEFFGYKDMDETCGPFNYECPKSILKLLTPTTNESAIHWRNKCWESAENKKKLKQLPIGSIIAILINEEIHHFTKIISFYNNKAIWVNMKMEMMIKEKDILTRDFLIIKENEQKYSDIVKRIKKDVSIHDKDKYVILCKDGSFSYTGNNNCPDWYGRVMNGLNEKETITN